MAGGQPRDVAQVVVDGRDITALLDNRLQSLTIRERRDEDADQLDLVVTDYDGRMAIPPTGAMITVSLGWQGRPLVGKGAFKVDEVEHAGAPDIITIRARSADFTADLRTRRDRSWRDTTLGAVLRDLAGRHGLTPRIEAGLAARPVPVIAQSAESDTALLRRLGRHYGAVATIKNGALIFAPAGSGQTATGKALPPFTITRADGDGHEWRRGQRDGEYTGVSASWHDVGAARRRSERAGAVGKVKRLRRVYATEAAARQAAEAELKRVRSGAQEFSISLALGRPELFPERQGTVAGFKAGVDGAYTVDETTHTLTADGGLTTQLRLEAA